jgi:hypothetical protein
MTDNTIDKGYKPRPEGEAYYGCDHTESYIDEPHSIVCVDGWMIDVDTYTEGYEEHDFKHPCRNCNPIAFKKYVDSNGEDE